MSSRGSITWDSQRNWYTSSNHWLASLPNTSKNTQHFVQQIHSKRLESGEVMTSFDVKALFTSVPVDPSIHIAQQKLAQDSTLPQRSNMSIQIVTFLEFCLKNTYLKTLTSSSKANFMNRSMVLPWVPPSVPSWPTCSWKSLRLKPLVPTPTHPLCG